MSLFQNILLKKHLTTGNEKIAAAYSRLAEYLDKTRTACQTLTTQITVTDHQIDRMVYDLYGLTEDEIVIIES